MFVGLSLHVSRKSRQIGWGFKVKKYKLFSVLLGTVATLGLSHCGITVSQIRTPEQAALDRVQAQGVDLARLDAIALAALSDGSATVPSASNGLKADYFSGTNPD